MKKKTRDNRKEERQVVGQTTCPMDNTDYSRLCIEAEECFTQVILRNRVVRRAWRTIQFSCIGGLFLTRIGSCLLAAWEHTHLKRAHRQESGTREGLDASLWSSARHRDAHNPNFTSRGVRFGREMWSKQRNRHFVVCQHGGNW